MGIVPVQYRQIGIQPQVERLNRTIIFNLHPRQLHDRCPIAAICSPTVLTLIPEALAAASSLLNPSVLVIFPLAPPPPSR